MTKLELRIWKEATLLNAKILPQNLFEGNYFITSNHRHYSRFPGQECNAEHTAFSSIEVVVCILDNTRKLY